MDLGISIRRDDAISPSFMLRLFKGLYIQDKLSVADLERVEPPRAYTLRFMS